MKRISIYLLFILWLSCKETSNEKSVNNSIPNYTELTSYDIKLKKPKKGEWLSIHKEKGQTYDQYVKSKPVHPSEDLNCIYIQPIGEFTIWEKKIMDLNTEYIRLFFGLKVVQLKPIKDSKIPKDKKRNHLGSEQLDAGYIINEILPKEKPKDAIVVMALTAKDLYPKPEWNFVFGLANYNTRTGITSIYRYSNSSIDAYNYHSCLQRIIKTSTHEISHMFGVKHCINAICLMNGVNSLEEADTRYNALCSECLAKLSWNLNFENVSRLNRLIDFLDTHHLEKDVLVLTKQRDCIRRK